MKPTTLHFKVEKALREVCRRLPALGGIAHSVKVILCEDTPRASISPSGVLRLNPSFAGELSNESLVFVLAHELLHLALNSHSRSRGKDSLIFNVASDAIINDILEAELGIMTPQDGVRYWHNLDSATTGRRSSFTLTNARLLSAELIYEQLKKKSDNKEREALQKLSGDLLSGEKEREMYTPESAAPGMSPKESAFIDALITDPPPLHKMIQYGLEDGSQRRRTYSRASRRGFGDYVAPGRKRDDGAYLNVVLCLQKAPRELLVRLQEIFEEFCLQNDIQQLRVLRMDTNRYLDLDEIRADLRQAKERGDHDAVRRIEQEGEAKLLDYNIVDSVIEPEALAAFALGGTSSFYPEPALDLLQQEGRTQASVVITKGLHPNNEKKRPFDLLYLCLRCAHWFWVDAV